MEESESLLLIWEFKVRSWLKMTPRFLTAVLDVKVILFRLIWLLGILSLSSLGPTVVTSVFFDLQSLRVKLSPPKKFLLVSSDHITIFQASSESSKWSVLNFTRACTSFVLSRGTLCALQDFKSWRHSVLPKVSYLTVVRAALSWFTSSPLWFEDDFLMFAWSRTLYEVRSSVKAPNEVGWQWRGASSICG